MPKKVSVDSTYIAAPLDGLPTDQLSKKASPQLINRRWLPNRRVIWLVLALLFVTPFVVSIPAGFHYLSTVCPIDTYCSLGPMPYPSLNVIQVAGLTPTAVAAYIVTFASITAVSFFSVGLFIGWRKSKDRMAFLVSLMLLTLASQSLNIVAGSQAIPGIASPTLALFFQLESFMAGTIGVATMLFFPDEHFTPKWVRWLFLLGMLNEGIYAFVPGNAIVGLFAVVKDAMFYGLIISVLVVQIYRFRRLSTPVQRQQTKWVVYGLTITAGGYGITSTFIPIVFGAFLNTHVLAFLLNITVQYVFILFLPVSVAIAITSSRLRDIDLLINRSVVYGSMTVVLIAIFALILTAFDLVFQNFGNGQQSGFALLTAGLLFGAIFNPTRRSIQQFVDRHFYGIRINYQRPLHQSLPTQLPSSNSTLPRLGSVELLESLGHGGMGEVYRARHTTLGKTVAVKLMSSIRSQDTEYRRRFEREARIVATLKHPNIVQVFDFGEADESLYIVMEYVDGSNLSEFLVANGRLTLTQALPLLREIASALDYAHEKGIVHRDIKATNIMLEPIAGNKHRAVLLDFGIAKMNNGTLLTQDGIFGSLEYIAPEQIQDSANVDARADVYAFGVLCYRMLTGVLPFNRSNPSALMLAHLQQPPPDPRVILPDLAEDKAIAICRALAKSPDDRHPTAGTLVNTLGQDR